MTTRVLGLTEMTENQQGKWITLNEALHGIDAFVGGVKSMTNGGPPGGPTQGDAYIVDVATGNWAGFTVGDIAFYYLDSAAAAAWIGLTPTTAGPTVYVEDTATTVIWDGAAWLGFSSVGLSEDQALTSPATYTMVLTDSNKCKRFTAATAFTVVIPTNASVAFPLHTQLTVRRAGAGAITVDTTGLTINGTIALAAQHDSFMIKKTATDTWDVYLA